MEEGVFAVFDVDKSSVETGHEAPDPSEEDISNREVGIGFLMVQLNEFGIFEERDFHFGGSGINDQFFFHAAGALDGHTGETASVFPEMQTWNGWGSRSAG
jgi:hypothetical protein